ncbi:DsbA family oxidoreductase [uncultured Paracoccus sp.]|uniref:DsbA family oxidoreductase n=1 Tax=Paracoccus sp. S1E-3 TaxID=2756130 RepID=UPI0015EF51FA|nr:DsbA family oxidoreductase [uncultured Paracoccus sp.]MBA4492391.1 DsbA family oxidoreductase [Paracoccus sp. S1E-3]
MSTPIKIDIWSDIACPWCYIGKRRLESALAGLSDGKTAPEVEIQYHSYELDPSAPAEYPGNHAEYLARHLGASAEQVRQMDEQITGLAAAEGLDYHLGDIQVTNTGKAHELIHFAESQGKGPEMKERLLRAYFVEGRHVGRIAELADLAAEIGLDRAAAEQALQAGSFAKAVEEDKEQAQAYGIRGVPFFVIDGKYAVSGAQEAETFLQALRKVEAEHKAAV